MIWQWILHANQDRHPFLQANHDSVISENFKEYLFRFFHWLISSIKTVFQAPYTGDIAAFHQAMKIVSFTPAYLKMLSATKGHAASSHCWGYYPGTLTCSQVITTHLKIRHPWMKSTGDWSSNELHKCDLKIGHQDSSPGHGLQGDTPYWPGWFWPQCDYT